MEDITDLVKEPPGQQGNKYDVFLSFRGEDSQESFSARLCSFLCNSGISMMKDDISIEQLQSIIERSKISIIIFSKHYAGSRSCLQVLTKIMECHKAYGQVVLPIFYGVEPVEVRNQKFGFGAVFQDLTTKMSPSDESEVARWRVALTEAGSISGFIVPIFETRDEGEIVKEVVEDVIHILGENRLFIVDHPVGVDNRVQEVINMLQNLQSKNVVMVGIWGMGGIGKTTIAKAIYNKIGHMFEGKSCLLGIREVWNKKKGPVSLQNQLLSEICKTTNVKVNNTEIGKTSLRERLRNKKALIVLDDVDKSTQLDALVGSPDWFGQRSVIIITTRDMHLLLKMDCHVYEMKVLDMLESIELLSWHAFKQRYPKEDLMELSKAIVNYSGGLPLALKVLGSDLRNRKAEEWRSILDRLKVVPSCELQNMLKTSFDSLYDLEKEIFLDISSFFIGMDRNYVTLILNGCGFFADVGISTLVERSLLTIDEKNQLSMHDLLRDMGREIIRKESIKHLGKRSRLWFPKDAAAVLLQHTGTKAIEGLSLKWTAEKVLIYTKAFKNMKRLRLLYLDNVELHGDYKYISQKLIWLCWHNSSIEYIPSSFYQENLVAIDLQFNSLKQVWEQPMLLEMLKILNLSHSRYLVQTPDFLYLPNLEQLILKDCPSLSEIDQSIRFLKHLILLDLEDCTGLHALPRSIYRLKTLILSGCINIDKLEEDIEQMESLTTLFAPTSKQVPFSSGRLKSILHLSLCGHRGLARHVIPSLYRSWISPTKNPLSFIPTHIVGVPSLSLCGTLDNIYGPSTIPAIEPQEQRLLLQDGFEINSLSITNCMDILRHESCLGHILIRIGSNSQVFHTLSGMVSQGLNITKNTNDCILPGDNIPYWLTFKDEGESVKFKVPLVNGHEHLKGMHVCCVYSTSGDLDKKECESCIICLMIINYTKATHFLYMEDKLKSLEEAEMKGIISNLESNDQVEVKAVSRNGFTLKKTAAYLIYRDSFDDDEQIEPSQSKTINLVGTKRKCEEEEEEDEEEAHQSIKPRKEISIYQG